MKKLGFALYLCATALVAQTVETIPFRAVLSSANEVPAASVVSSGAATVWLHVVRDASGKVVSGSADANVSYRFPAAVTITAMHIHNGPAGANAGIVLPFAISRTDDATGAGSLPPVQTQFPSSAVTLDTVNGILADPSQFYFNIHTTDAPGGAMRGQLQRAEMVVRMGVMKGENETPPIPGQTWSGLSTVTALITRAANGQPNSALVIFDCTYSGFPDDTTFTGYHIHLGPPGVTAPVTINTGLRNLPAGQGGSGTLHYEVEADVSQQPVVDTLNALVFNPAGATYINLHTSVSPGGAVRSPLLATDRMDFQVMMSTANEVPPVTPDGTAPAVVSVYTVRNPDGTPATGTVIFDANPRLASGSAVTAMHIHDQVAGQNGPVTIDSGLGTSPVLISDGTGNIYRIAQVKTAAALASLNSLVVNPEKHYVNMHTTASPGGVVRSQLSPASSSTPLINWVETGVQDPSLTTLAPGGLTYIAGPNLAKVATDLSGFNGTDRYPASLNGVSVTIGGKQAAIYLLNKDRVFAQVPFDTPTGLQPVVVTNGNGASAPFNVNVAAAAPAIFITGTGALAVRADDLSTITPATPAKAGDLVVILATGLGQTNPPLQTGKIVPDISYQTGPVTVKLGGQNVPVVGAAAFPGYAGVYGVAIGIPPGLSGNLPVQLQMGTVTSNVSSLAIK